MLWGSGEKLLTLVPIMMWRGLLRGTGGHASEDAGFALSQRASFSTGWGILRSTFAGSFRGPPLRATRMASKALHAVRRRVSCGVGWMCRETNAPALSLTP